jgi:hypothetical protein
MVRAAQASRGRPAGVTDSLGARAAPVRRLALSFAWVAAVDLTPAGQRPCAGSSSNNTATDLVFGYNGLDRMFGGSMGAGAYAGSVGNDPGDPGPLRLLALWHPGRGGTRGRD